MCVRLTSSGDAAVMAEAWVGDGSAGLSHLFTSSMPRPRAKTVVERPLRADAQRNRARILGVAKQVFARTGADATMDDIAKRAGIGPGTLYRHFPTRDALLEEVYRAEVEKLAAAARRLADTLPPFAALRAWLLLFVEYMEEKHIIAPALNTMVGGADRLYAGSRNHVQGAIEMLVARAIASGELRKDVVAMDLMLALIGMAGYQPAEQWKASGERLVETLLRGSMRTSESAEGRRAVRRRSAAD